MKNAETTEAEGASCEIPPEVKGQAGCGLRSGHDESGAQKRRKPPQKEVEVEAGCCKDDVDAVADLALEVVAVDAMLGLEVADPRLDGGTPYISRLMGRSSAGPGR
jgi:hypothetical protein